ncbi:MAG: N-acetylmuramoyl-L-alanine amidase [Clostridia bacterium]|nr:N-acetylmuramoyl-L-alanine amidase [Clostridia bacterium]
MKGTIDRVKLHARLLLGVTAMCSAMLLFCAGDSAVRTFAGGAAQETAAGEEYAGVLNGMRIAVDAGHGGYDGGAVGRVSGVPEKGLNLDVAVKVRELLLEKGAEVIMTRTDDYALCDDNPPIRRKLQDMQRRAAIVMGGGADLLLSIHMNEYAGRSQSGPQVFYREGCPAGRLLAGAVQTAMVRQLQPRKEREALGGDYYILTFGIPGVLVECGFLSNREEEELLLSDAYRQRVAQGIVQGVCDWAALPGERPKPLEAVDRSGEETGG